MTMWKLRSCPRCGGDLFVDKDMENWYEQCLQCSYRHELKSLAEFEKESLPKEQELTAAGGTRLKRHSHS